MNRPGSAAGYWLPLALAAVSGAAGLAHQLLWVRRMVDVLGANAGTFSRVIAAFFLGLAGGAWLAARTSTPHPWRSVARAECTVAALALPVLCAGAWAQHWQAHPALVRVLPWLLPLVLVAPPAVAMGTVIPWMIRGVGPARSVALYGVNTLGGIAGLAFTLAWALPALGLAGASFVAIGLNVLVAVAAARFGGSDPPIPISANEGRGESALRENLRPSANGLAFASGFLVLATEVINQHQFAQFFVSSHLSSAIVLALFLAALGVGALLVPWVSRWQARALPAAVALAAIACALQPFILIVQRGGLIYLPYQEPLAAYTLDALKLGLPACTALLLPAALVFPLLLRDTTNAGRLLAINGLGGWCGAELAERFIAPIFGLWWSMAVLAAGYALALLLLPGMLRWWLAPALGALIVWSWKIDARLPFAGLAKGETLVSVAVGREGVVGVVRGEPDDWRILFNNNYTLGGSRAQFNQERQTLLPMLLHGEAHRVATLGVATGSSLAGATLDPALEFAEGIELSPLVLRFARAHFAQWNRRVLDEPRVRLTIGDARIVIAQRPAQFDVIAGDLFLPWRTGEGRLFTREHFQNVRAALRPGGLYCQWLPMFQLTRAQYEAIGRTFREVFPDAWLIRGDFYTETPILGLVGGREVTAFRWEKMRAACDRTRAANLTRDPLLRHADGVAMCLIGPLPTLAPGPVNTLANSWLEWDAAHNLIGLRAPWFTGIPCAEYIRDIHQTSAAHLPENLRAAHAAGQFFLTLEIARAANLPQATALTSEAREHLPESLRDDADASWREWPMRHRPSLP